MWAVAVSAVWPVVDLVAAPRTGTAAVRPRVAPPAARAIRSKLTSIAKIGPLAQDANGLFYLKLSIVPL